MGIGITTLNVRPRLVLGAFLVFSAACCLALSFSPFVHAQAQPAPTAQPAAPAPAPVAPAPTAPVATDPATTTAAPPPVAPAPAPAPTGSGTDLPEGTSAENPLNLTLGDLFGSLPAVLASVFGNIWLAWSLLAASLVGNIILFTELRKNREIAAIERTLKENSQRQMEFQAMYDALTQLPNRRLFHDRLLETFKLCNRSRTRFGVMVTDLDHFKEINDTMGHDAGDELLGQVSKRLRAVMRESDTLARMGGDEFALICPSINDFKTASVVSLRMIQALQEPIIIKGKVAPVGISIGVALFPDHGTDTEILLRRADMAMYRAKQKRNSYALYDPNVDR